MSAPSLSPAHYAAVAQLPDPQAALVPGLRGGRGSPCRRRVCPGVGAGCRHAAVVSALASGPSVRHGCRACAGVVGRLAAVVSARASGRMTKQRCRACARVGGWPGVLARSVGWLLVRPPHHHTAHHTRPHRQPPSSAPSEPNSHSKKGGRGWSYSCFSGSPSLCLPAGGREACAPVRPSVVALLVCYSFFSGHPSLCLPASGREACAPIRPSVVVLLVRLLWLLVCCWCVGTSP